MLTSYTYVFAAQPLSFLMTSMLIRPLTGDGDLEVMPHSFLITPVW